MKRQLSEKALTQILQWDPEGNDIDIEIRALEAHSVKYDAYQQFEPGFRFMESLVNWLTQFKNISDTRTAYQFIRDRLIFISEFQIRLLVESSFVNHIRPSLLTEIALEKNIERHKLVKLYNTIEFESYLKRSLFLGLSDGARTDVFRRSNNFLSNEQVWLTYSFNDDKIKDFEDHLNCLPKSEQNFKYVWLMDDFSASGTSFIRFDKKDQKWKGKIPKTIELMKKMGGTILDVSQIKVYVLLYIATYKTEEYINECLDKYFQESGIQKPELLIIQKIEESVPLSFKNKDDQKFLKMIDLDQYYDPDIFNESHGKIGGTNDFKRGYAGCALPIVLEHNCPNNSVSIIWSHEKLKFVGLFPRVSRH